MALVASVGLSTGCCWVIASICESSVLKRRIRDTSPRLADSRSLADFSDGSVNCQTVRDYC